MLAAIASAEALGIPAVDLMLYLLGGVSAEAFGLPTITLVSEGPDFSLVPQLYPWSAALPVRSIELLASPQDIALQFHSARALALVANPADIRVRFYSRRDIYLPGGTP